VRRPELPGSGVYGEELAEHYDATRALSQETMARLVATLGSELRGRGRCLEVGVGTGRIAIPLAASGVNVIGIDPSAPMLARLLRKTEGFTPFPVIRADATALPFANGSFGAGLVSHVLHLIPDWTTALAELVRVVRRRGLIMVSMVGRGRQEGWSDLRAHFFHSSGVPVPHHLGVRETAAVTAMMEALGGRSRSLPSLVERREQTVEEAIHRLEMGIHLSTLYLPLDVRRRAGEATRRWAHERFGALDVPIQREGVIAWQAYDLS